MSCIVSCTSRGRPSRDQTTQVVKGSRLPVWSDLEEQVYRSILQTTHDFVELRSVWARYLTSDPGS